MNTKIKLSTLKRELLELDASESIITTILNTARTYNDLLQRFNNGEKIQPYILAGYNGQLYNQILNLTKLKQRNDLVKQKEQSKKDKLELENAPDEFELFVNKFRN